MPLSDLRNRPHGPAAAVLAHIKLGEGVAAMIDVELDRPEDVRVCWIFWSSAAIGRFMDAVMWPRKWVDLGAS